MQDTWVQSLGQEDPLEKEMATHFSILAWRIPWMEEPGGLQSSRLHRVGHNCVTEQQQKEKKWWRTYLNCTHIIPINFKTLQHYIPYSMEKFEIHGNQVTCSSFMVLMVPELESNSGCFHWTSMQLLSFYLPLFGWVLWLQRSGDGVRGYFTEDTPSKWSLKVE